MKINFLIKNDEFDARKLNSILSDHEVITDFENIGDEEILIVDISLLEELKDQYF